MKSSAFSSLAVTVMLATSPYVHANLLINGSFETPAVASGSFTNFNTGSAAITGWTVFGPQVSIVSGSFVQSGVSFVAQDGIQWLDLTGLNANSAEGVSQIVSTIIGNQYQLSYFIGNTTALGFGPTSTVDVLLNGVLSFTDTNSHVSPTTQDWQQFTHTFVATGTSTILALRNADPSSDNNNGLDNVVLLDLGPAGPVAPTPTPEPGSLALLGSVAALWALVTRRRRAA
jgi:hypothetical protein